MCFPARLVRALLRGRHGLADGEQRNGQILVGGAETAADFAGEVQLRQKALDHSDMPIKRWRSRN